jgi:hypothetical protein
LSAAAICSYSWLNQAKTTAVRGWIVGGYIRVFSSSLYGALALERQSMIHFYNLIGIVDDVVCAIDHPISSQQTE